MSQRRYPKKLRKWRSLAAGDARLLLEAAVFLAIARAAVLLIPFRFLAGLVDRAPVQPARDPNPALNCTIGWAVATAARNVPWRAACLPCALAAKAMLSRRGYRAVLHFGVGRDETGALVAHAWLEAGGTIVVGGGGAQAVTPLARFGDAFRRLTTADG
jgi:Transglutaminase-like superfamily